jgi:hypothetical protein
MLGGDTVAAFRRWTAADGFPAEMIEHDIATAYAWPETLPPCPAWCRYREFDAEHDYIGPVNGVAAATFIRVHVSGVGDPHLAQREEPCVSAVTQYPLMIAVGEDAEPISGDKAREYAGELLAAVIRVEELYPGASSMLEPRG